MKIAILALQGAFIEHEEMLKKLDVTCVEIRQKKDLDKDFDGLIIPGGESTVIGKLLRELDIYGELKRRIEEGLPVLGTCAGLILLAQKLSNDNRTHLATLPVTVKRNAYGRQLGSFVTNSKVSGVGEIPMTFIRAPYIEKVEQGVQVLATVNDNIVAVRYHNQIGLSFHPEVTDCIKIHEYFVKICKDYCYEKDTLFGKKSAS